MDDFEDKQQEWEIRSLFPENDVGRSLRQSAIDLWRATPLSERWDAVSIIQDAAAYVRSTFASNAYSHSGSLDEWFQLPTKSLTEMASHNRVLREQSYVELTDEEQELEWAAEAEQDRLDQMEQDGFFGRTLPYYPESDDWIYIRFGSMPEGASICGLTLDENEDGPNPWRVELGNLSHEAGICVFRGYRHPDHDGAYILEQPCFELARYGVGSQEDHLNAIIPRVEDGEVIPVLKIKGSLATTKAMNGMLRADLGSDGEYLLATNKPMSAEALSLDQVWVSESYSVKTLLWDRRGYDPDQQAPKFGF